jgi:hypothetical protein
MPIPAAPCGREGAFTPDPFPSIQPAPTTAQKGAQPVEQRVLIKAGPVEPCETCGTPVRTSQYQGGRPRLNEVRNGRDMPGGHTPQTCQERRNR